MAEKDEQEAQLSEHLRESIKENQSIISELSKAKEQIDDLKDQLEAQSQSQAQSNRHSPGKRRSKRSSPRLKLQLQLDPSMGSPLRLQRLRTLRRLKSPHRRTVVAVRRSTSSCQL